MINDKRFEIAYKLSDLITKDLTRSDCDEMIRTATLVKLIEKHTGIKTAFTETSFRWIDDGRAKKGYSLRRIILNDEGKKQCEIILNSDKSAVWQRMSLIQALGHLMIDNEKTILTPCVDPKYALCEAVTQDITRFTEEDYKKDPYLIKEQRANIFMLRCLMPAQTFWQKLIELDSLKKTAAFFGVTTDSVISRIMLVR